MSEAHLALLLGALILAPFAGALVHLAFRGARTLRRRANGSDVYSGR